MTQSQLAAAVGRDQATIARYEAGTIAPGRDTAVRIAAELRISVLDVLYPSSAKVRPGTAA